MKEGELIIGNLDSILGEGDGNDVNLLEGVNKDGDKKDGDGNKQELGKKDGDGNVDPEPEPKPDPKPDPEPDNKVSKFDYKNIVNSLIKRKVIDDISDYSFQVGDNEEQVSFKDLEIADEEAFLDLIENVVKQKEEGLLKDKIDTSSVSDFTKQLIEAEKSGANVNTILNVYKKYQAPVQDIDLSDKADQLKVIRHYLSSLNIPEDEVEETYEMYKKQGDDFIEAKARKFKDVLDAKMSEYIEKQKKEAEEKRKEDEENGKRYRKDFRKAATESFQLNDKTVNKVADFALALDNNRETGLLKRFREIMKEPSTAVELAMYLMDPEEFIRQKSSAKLKNERLNTIKLMGRTNKSRSSSEGGSDNKDDDGFDLTGAIVMK